MNKSKSKWISFTVPLGNLETAQERRGSYESAAFSKGMNMSAWARSVLDEAAGVKKEAVKDSEGSD